MDVMNFIKPELLILVPVLYTVGLGIKKSKVSDNYIPLILGIVSIFLSTLWVISTSDIKNWQDAVYAVFISITQSWSWIPIIKVKKSMFLIQLEVQS